jgi:hypothetical protein
MTNVEAPHWAPSADQLFNGWTVTGTDLNSRRLRHETGNLRYPTPRATAPAHVPNVPARSETSGA